MARVTYVPLDDDEILSIDPETDQPLLTRRGPNADNYMIVLVGVGYAALAAIVMIILGLGFWDLAFGNTG